MPNKNNFYTFVDTNPESITVLINRKYVLPANYVPCDLVIPSIPFDFHGYHEKKLMRYEPAKALEKLFQKACEETIFLNGISGYRSYERQLAIYNKNIKEKGFEHTNQYCAKAGSSEHQSGLAIDVSTASIHNQLETSFAYTKEGKWLVNHCWKFGFILRYPKEKTHITGYAYEPWHIRYVGVKLASYLTKHHLTLEEFYRCDQI